MSLAALVLHAVATGTQGAETARSLVTEHGLDAMCAMAREGSLHDRVVAVVVLRGCFTGDGCCRLPVEAVRACALALLQSACQKDVPVEAARQFGTTLGVMARRASGEPKIAQEVVNGVCAAALTSDSALALATTTLQALRGVDDGLETQLRPLLGAVLKASTLQAASAADAGDAAGAANAATMCQAVLETGGRHIACAEPEVLARALTKVLLACKQEGGGGGVSSCLLALGMVCDWFGSRLVRDEALCRDIQAVLVDLGQRARGVQVAFVRCLVALDNMHNSSCSTVSRALVQAMVWSCTLREDMEHDDVGADDEDLGEGEYYTMPEWHEVEQMHARVVCRAVLHSMVGRGGMEFVAHIVAAGDAACVAQGSPPSVFAAVAFLLGHVKMTQRHLRHAAGVVLGHMLRVQMGCAPVVARCLWAAAKVQGCALDKALVSPICAYMRWFPRLLCERLPAAVFRGNDALVQAMQECMLRGADPEFCAHCLPKLTDAVVRAVNGVDTVGVCAAVQAVWRQFSEHEPVAGAVSQMAWTAMVLCTTRTATRLFVGMAVETMRRSASRASALHLLTVAVMTDADFDGSLWEALAEALRLGCTVDDDVQVRAACARCLGALVSKAASVSSDTLGTCRVQIVECVCAWTARDGVRQWAPVVFALSCLPWLELTSLVLVCMREALVDVNVGVVSMAWVALAWLTVHNFSEVQKAAPSGFWEAWMAVEANAGTSAHARALLQCSRRQCGRRCADAEDAVDAVDAAALCCPLRMVDDNDVLVRLRRIQRWQPCRRCKTAAFCIFWCHLCRRLRGATWPAAWPCPMWRKALWSLMKRVCMVFTLAWYWIKAGDGDMVVHVLWAPRNTSFPCCHWGMACAVWGKDSHMDSAASILCRAWMPMATSMSPWASSSASTGAAAPQHEPI
jgi:hypothetical protein